MLIDTMLQRLAPQRALKLDVGTLRLLRHYAFPDNIRELRNVLERAILLADGDVILPEHLPKTCRAVTSETMNADSDEVVTQEENERRYLLRMLARHPDDRESLARHLGLRRRPLFRKLQALQKGSAPPGGGDGK